MYDSIFVYNLGVDFPAFTYRCVICVLPIFSNHWLSMQCAKVFNVIWIDPIWIEKPISKHEHKKTSLYHSKGSKEEEGRKGFIIRKIGNICGIIYARKPFDLTIKKSDVGSMTKRTPICCMKERIWLLFALKVQYLQERCKIALYTNRNVSFEEAGCLAMLFVVLRIATWTECKLMSIKVIAVQRNIVGNIMMAIAKRWASHKECYWNGIMRECCFPTNEQMWKKGAEVIQAAKYLFAMNWRKTYL